MFTKSLEKQIGECYRSARQLRHEFMTTEDLLLALLGDSEVEEAIVSSKGDVATLRSDLVKYITKNSKVLPPQDESDTQPTLGFQRVLQRAVYHVQSSGLKEVTALRCLVAVYGEKDSYAVKALTKQDIQRLDIINFITNGEIKESPPTPAETIERIKDSPPVTAASTPTLRIFVSYSHNDSSFLDRLLVHLKPLERKSRIDCWSDRKIQAGARWKDEISANIEQAAVAVLLVSADFLASDFIANHELPPLLIKADAKGTRIIPVIVKPCGFHRDETLSSFQCINDPRSPLLGLGEIDQERLYEQIANEIYKELLIREKRA